jgi:hypothetical protein
MRYKMLGNSGLRVSELALGTMTFGDGVADTTVSQKLFDAFLEAGVNFRLSLHRCCGTHGRAPPEQHRLTKPQDQGLRLRNALSYIYVNAQNSYLDVTRFCVRFIPIAGDPFLPGKFSRSPF